ncbi:MAG: bifunctional phosphoribosylaminoimidazolecarboxamide formyltransferase/IMP cyclohydrolase, partial [bacterium]
MKRISQALISVQDKRDVVELAAFLAKRDVSIISMGATAKLLERNKIKVTEISRLTGFSDMLNDHINALHPVIYGALLCPRNDPAHMDCLKSLGVDPIDLVIVNTPPFQPSDIDDETGKKWQEVLSQISVSGISLIRAAARNFPDVAILTDPDQYKPVMEEMEKRDMQVSLETRKKLALKAFELLVSYDMEVHKFLAKKFHQEEQFHNTLLLKYEKAYDLRYGENPHQKAAFYREPDFEGASLSNAEQLWGKSLSYNNVADMDAALKIVMEFDKTAVAVVKHGNPIGVAVDRDTTRAYMKARDVDQASAFGSVVAFNDTVEKKTAKELTTTFIEAVVSPRFTEGAVEEIKKGVRGKHMRVIQLTTGKRMKQVKEVDVRKVSGGLLVQDSDFLLLPRGGHLKVLTKRKP